MAADIERIKKMENLLTECKTVTSGLSGELDKMEDIRDHMTELFGYYGSEDWYEDREGEIPADITAGVLSEDEVYDVITDVRDAAFRMLELATDILKNRI